MLTGFLIGLGILLLLQVIAFFGARSSRRELLRLQAEFRARGRWLTEEETACANSLRAYLHSGPFFFVWPGTALGWLAGGR